MNDFVYQNPAKIIFGKNTECKAASEILPYGNKVLLVLGGSFIKENGLYDRVVSSFDEVGIEYFDLEDITPNPRLCEVKKGIEICKNNDINFVLAIGGGSAIDTAKTIAAAMRTEGEIWDYFDNFTKFVTDALPIGVILTLPATGSECSNCAVITNEKTNLKRSLFTDSIIPRFAILNPEMSYTLPSIQSASGAMDMFSHLLEMYFTPAQSTDFTDRLLEGAMKSVMHFAPLALKEPDNYDVRAELFLAANIINNGILAVGRAGGDWGSHNIEHEISSMYNIPHGMGMGIVFPAWMRYCWKKDVKRFVQLSERVFGVEYARGDDEHIVIAGIEKLEEFIKSLNLPIHLSDIGYGKDKIDEIAHNALIGRYGIGMYLTLDEHDVREVLNIAAG